MALRSRRESEAAAAVDEILYTARDGLGGALLEPGALEPRLLGGIRDEAGFDEDRGHVGAEEHVEERLFHSMIAYPSHPAAQRTHERRLNGLREVPRVGRVRLGPE